VDEFDLIHRYFDRDTGDADVVVGVGDDGAVLCPAAGRHLVSVVDTSVENVHFPESLPAADIGFRSVAVNLSDLAAMGSRPRWMLLALTLPKVDADWLSEFSEGLYAAADEHRVALAGGDTTHGGTLVVSVHMIGDVDPQMAMRRDAAMPGDEVWLTGSTGDAAAGLRLFQEGSVAGDAAAFLVGRFRRPRARVAIGQKLARFANAAIDVSDGLFADAHKLAQSSSVALSLHLERIPLSPALCKLFADDAEVLSLTGGDDYELLFTAPADSAAEIQRIADAEAVPATRIGQVSTGIGATCYRDGNPVSFDDPGYRHFHE